MAVAMVAPEQPRKSGLSCLSVATCTWQVLFFLFLAVLTQPASSSPAKDDIKSFTPAGKDGVFRLPSHVKPVHYDLTIEPFRHNETFNGVIDIELHVLNRTHDIVLHAQDLDIRSSSIVSGSTEQQSLRWETDDKTQTIRLKLPHALASGSKPKLQLHFTGPLRSDMSGFFSSPFTSRDGTNGTILTTFMAPTYTRRAFPCFDEPALKATFTLTIVADPDEICIANMPVEERRIVTDAEGTSKAVTKFQRTPPMSTYLAAWAIGELSYVENNDARVPVRVYTSPADDPKLGTYSAGIVARGLTWYEKTFKRQYSLPKLDILAAPAFLGGAMENWGLIVSLSTLASHDPEVDGAMSKEVGAQVLLHELAHQWFGNLVTLEWWDQTWLNEGGTTSVSLYCLQQLEPTWEAVEYKDIDMLSSAFGKDSYRTSHPIEIPIEKDEDIEQSFDEISYKKGAITLRMIREFIGADVFFDGLADYLDSLSFGNAKTADLWDALSKASGEDVAALMDPWTKTTGYPYVKVIEEDKTIHVEQHRFLTTGDCTDDEDTLWPVFLDIRSSSGVEKAKMVDRRTTLELSGDDFFLLNANHSGLYRVWYSEERLHKLTSPDHKRYLNPQEIAGLIADTCALAHAGYHKTSTCLDLLETILDGNEDVTVWLEAAQQIQIIQNACIEEETVARAFRDRMREWSTKLSHRLGWRFSPSDAHNDHILKSTLFKVAGKAGDSKIVEWSKHNFSRFMSGDQDAIGEPILREAFRIALLHGGVPEYEALVKYSRRAPSLSRRETALGALFATNDASLVRRTLDMISSGDLQGSNLVSVLSGASQTQTSRDMLWEWVRTDWPRIRRDVLPDSFGVPGFFTAYVTGDLSTRKQLRELKEFIEREDVRNVEGELGASYERLRGVVKWAERDGEDVKHWLGVDGSDEL